MFGLMVLSAAAMYLLLMCSVVRWAWRRARAGGGSRVKAAAFGAGGFLLVYLPVFWNHIPTVLMHRQLCAKDASFTAYVDAQQWRMNNTEALAVVNRLPQNEREKSTKVGTTPDGYSRYASFGGLLMRDAKHERIDYLGLIGDRYALRIVDARTDEVLAAQVDYFVGKREDLRVWLHRPGCTTRPRTSIGEQVKPTSPLDFLHMYERKLVGEQP